MLLIKISRKMRAERPLGLVMMLSKMTLTRAVLVDYSENILTGLYSRKNGRECGDSKFKQLYFHRSVKYEYLMPNIKFPS